MSTEFNTFINKNQDWITNLEIYKQDHAVFQRVVCHYDNPSTHSHYEYHACINVENGDVYSDCSKKLILAKHVALIIARPIHTLIKTLWHLSIIPPLALEIIKFANKEQTFNDLASNTVKSLADIIRTPIYGIALTVAHIAGALLGCVSPNTLYRSRAIEGKIERKMLRLKKIHYRSDWQLSPCFSPLRNLVRKADNSPIEPSLDDIKAVLNKFARTSIQFHQRNECLFTKYEPTPLAIS